MVKMSNGMSLVALGIQITILGTFTYTYMEGEGSSPMISIILASIGTILTISGIIME